MIKEGKSIDRMLLVTFTDAAAKSMREKIRQEFQAIAQDPQEPKKLRDKMSDQINRLAGADISTIHAFCLRLIKRYYYLIDLDPQFRLLTDQTEQLLLMEEVWQEVSERFYQEPNHQSDGAASFAELVENFSSDRDDQGLDDLVLKLYDVANAQPDPTEWLKHLPDHYRLTTNLLESPFYQEVCDVASQRLAQARQDTKEALDRARTAGLDKDTAVLEEDNQRLQLLLSQLTGDLSQVLMVIKQTQLVTFKGRAKKDFKDRYTALQDDWETFTVSLSASAKLDQQSLRDQLETFKAKLIALKDQAPTKKAHDLIDRNVQTIDHLLGFCLQRSWDSIQVAFKYASFSNTPAKPKGQEDVAEDHALIKDERKKLRETISGIAEDFFSYKEQQLRTLSARAQRVLTRLSRVTIAFKQRYQQVKNNRHLMEFSDLEHNALKILTPPADQPDWQELVKDLRAHYQEIMIDEYQDTNQLQEKILMQLTSPQSHKLFMVGDVKQSIYRFREADPSLFLQKYRDYRQENPDNQAIILKENYRSMRGVTAFTNLVFKQLMDVQVGEIAYDQDAELKYAATYYDSSDANQVKPTEVMLYVANANSAAPQDDYEPDKEAGELRMVGAKIKSLVTSGYQIFDSKTQQMRPVNYNDIVILERTKKINNTLMEEFNKLDIPLTVHDVESYFQTVEVRVMVSLLKVIDNPHQDIPLVAVLRSPMVQLTNKELAFIRLQNQSVDYYTALQLFRYRYQNKQKMRPYGKKKLLSAQEQKSLYDKVATFFNQLVEFRNTAKQQTLVDLIWQIYNQTGYLDYVGTMPGGQQRQANLHALYQRAQSYEESSFKGLYQFIRFIEKMQEHDKDLGIAPTQLTANTVNVMTIHGSKGLQFPIVFLVDTNRGFNNRSNNGNAVVDASAGVGIKWFDNQKFIRYDTPQRKLVIEQINRSERAEDMRILYVALTRAEQQLFITASFNEAQRGTGTLTSAWNRWQKAYQTTTTVLSPQLRLDANSFMDWLGLALTRHAGKTGFDVENLQKVGIELTSSPFADSNSESFNNVFRARAYNADQVTDLINEGEPKEGVQSLVQEQDAKISPLVKDIDINRVLAFRYPHATATRTTAYQSVTDVKRVFEDDDPRMGRIDYTPEDTPAKKQNSGIYINPDFAVPSFVQQDDPQPQATQVGTATHLVFQKLTLAKDQVTTDAVQKEIQDLVAHHLISPAVAAKIDYAGISAFFKTTIGQQILAHPSDYHREEPFAMIMNGHEPFADIDASDNDQVLIHGIIDGYLETAEGITLVDYKTDHVTAGSLKRVIRNYSGQLKLYTEALSMMKEIPVVQMGLYLVELKEFVSVHGGGDQSGDH